MAPKLLLQRCSLYLCLLAFQWCLLTESEKVEDPKGWPLLFSPNPRVSPTVPVIIILKILLSPKAAYSIAFRLVGLENRLSTGNFLLLVSIWLSGEQPQSSTSTGQLQLLSLQRVNYTCSTGLQKKSTKGPTELKSQKQFFLADGPLPVIPKYTKDTDMGRDFWLTVWQKSGSLCPCIFLWSFWLPI